MSTSDTEFSLSKGREILKSETDKRVSADAAEEINSELQRYGKKVAESAIRHARMDGRKTVRAVDIRGALRETGL
jgi:histone H3/H4